MSTIELFWVVFATIVLIIYGLTALAVIIGGVFDISKMFRYLKRKHQQDVKETED